MAKLDDVEDEQLIALYGEIAYRVGTHLTHIG